MYPEELWGKKSGNSLRIVPKPTWKCIKIITSEECSQEINNVRKVVEVMIINKQKKKEKKPFTYLFAFSSTKVYISFRKSDTGSK